MTRTTDATDVILNKIESTGINASFEMQLYIKTLRGNVPIDAIRLRVDDIRCYVNSRGYTASPRIEDLVINVIIATINQSLLRVGYSPRESMHLAFSQYEQAKRLINNEQRRGYGLDDLLCIHILPVELQHEDPVTMFTITDPDDFLEDRVSQYELVTLSHLGDETIAEFSDIITLYYILADEFRSTPKPESIPIELTEWEETGIPILDEALWEGLFSYNTPKIHRWIGTYLSFNY